VAKEACRGACGLIGMWQATAIFMLRTPRCPAPSMFRDVPLPPSGQQDIYGFEDVRLPTLPWAGVPLDIQEVRDSEPELGTHCWHGDAEDQAMWDKIQRYVLEQDSDLGEAGVGGEIWASAAALCSWLITHRDELCGSRVLELGSGTGVCGLYAAACGASVILTDGGPKEVLTLAKANAAANEDLLAGSKVDIRRLVWGEDEAVADLGTLDWVFASDVIYHEASYEALLSTIGALLECPDSPRVIISHEHRSRVSAPDAILHSWGEDDVCLERFVTAATRNGMHVLPLWSERPQCHVRGHFRSWSADISLMEVTKSPSSAGSKPSTLESLEPLLDSGAADTKRRTSST